MVEWLRRRSWVLARKKGKPLLAKHPDSFLSNSPMANGCVVAFSGSGFVAKVHMPGKQKHHGKIVISFRLRRGEAGELGYIGRCNFEEE